MANYSANAAAQAVNFVTGGLSIPGNSLWNQIVNDQTDNLTNGHPNNQTMKTAVAAWVLANTPGSPGQANAQQFLSDMQNSLLNGGVPASQWTSLVQSFPVYAAKWFPASPSPQGSTYRRLRPQPGYTSMQTVSGGTQMTGVRPRVYQGPPLPPPPPPQPVFVQTPPPQPFYQAPPQASYVPAPPPPPPPPPPAQTFVVPVAPPPPLPPPMVPAAVIQQGVSDLQQKAWAVVSKIAKGDVGAIQYLASQKQAAQAGDWNAKQFLTYAQSAFQQQGGDPGQARWQGEVSESVGYGCNTQDYLDALSLINRARSFDQNAIATLRSLHLGSGRARRVLRCVQEYYGGAVPHFGGSSHSRAPAAPRAKSTAAKKIVLPAPARHPAITSLKKAAAAAPAAAKTSGAQRFSAGGKLVAPIGVSGTNVNLGAHTALTSVAAVSPRSSQTPVSSTSLPSTAAQSQAAASQAAALAAAQQAAMYGAGSSGGGYSGGGGGGSSDNSGSSSSYDNGDDGSGNSDDSGGGDDSADVNGDFGLDSITGQQKNPHAAALVHAVRAGDARATQLMQETMRAARAGVPEAQSLANGVIRMVNGKPEYANEIANGHAVNLSHSHPLTPRRVKKIAEGVHAQFGAEGVRQFEAYMRAPHGPVVSHPHTPAWTGQVVGRAQAMQAARFPQGSLRYLSPQAASEFRQ